MTSFSCPPRRPQKTDPQLHAPRTPLNSATTAPAISPRRQRYRAFWNTPGLYMLQQQMSHQSPPSAEFHKTLWPLPTSAPAVPSGSYLHRVSLDHLVYTDLSSSHFVRLPLSEYTGAPIPYLLWLQLPCPDAPCIECPRTYPAPACFTSVVSTECFCAECPGPSRPCPCWLQPSHHGGPSVEGPKSPTLHWLQSQPAGQATRYMQSM